MGKVKGREQVFQLGVKFMKDIIEGEFTESLIPFTWNETTKDIILKFFMDKYQELKAAMPFLKVNEYPRIAVYVEGSKLKVHLQGWMNTCKFCKLLGGMWFNRKNFYDFNLCQNEIEPYLIVRYGDLTTQSYIKGVSGNFNMGIKWRAIKSLYNRIDEIVSINPIEILT